MSKPIGPMRPGGPSHYEVAGMLVCVMADGRALDWHKPDPWSFCPYCGWSLEAPPEPTKEVWPDEYWDDGGPHDEKDAIARR